MCVMESFCPGLKCVSLLRIDWLLFNPWPLYTHVSGKAISVSEKRDSYPFQVDRYQIYPSFIHIPTKSSVYTFRTGA